MAAGIRLRASSQCASSTRAPWLAALTWCLKYSELVTGAGLTFDSRMHTEGAWTLNVALKER